MKKIIQISESEYNELFDKANLNDTLINERAKQLYKDKGTFQIDATLRIADYEGDFVFKTEAEIHDWRKYQMSTEEKRVLIHTIQNGTTELIQRRFGEWITSLNSLKKERKDTIKIKRRSVVFGLLGWIALIAYVWLTH